jgi:hypothetical protein
MGSLKIASIWNFEIKDSIFFHLLKSISKKKIEITTPDKCDILFFGPMDSTRLQRKFLNFFLKKFSLLNYQNYFQNLDMYSLRNYKPLRVFFSHENFGEQLIPKYDYSITFRRGLVNKKHLGSPIWKEYVDWSHEGIPRENGKLNSRRFGCYYNLDEMLEPQGENFLKKKRSFCLFASHLSEPRKSHYLKIKEHFNIDGFGPYFDKNILNHNNSNFQKKDIMKNYAFNLCPENTLWPGMYTEKIPDSFLGKCLPVSYCDHNIQSDFNTKAFVNLLDHVKDNYESIMHLLKDDIFLKKFTKEPLLLSKPNLDQEKLFIEEIIKNFQ